MKSLLGLSENMLNASHLHSLLDFCRMAALLQPSQLIRVSSIHGVLGLPCTAASITLFTRYVTLTKTFLSPTLFILLYGTLCPPLVYPLVSLAPFSHFLQFIGKTLSFTCLIPSVLPPILSLRALQVSSLLISAWQAITRQFLQIFDSHMSQNCPLLYMMAISRH